MSNQGELIELTDLTPDNVCLADLPRFPGMTSWFNPVLLCKLLLRVIIADLFGQYADRRLIHAALDPASGKELEERAELQLKPDSDGAVWFDFVADLGDGFDATYAIAYLLAQPDITVDGHKLPRGGALIMGGDEVYPTASRDQYSTKLRKPYSFAFPETQHSPRIPVLMLPGNHDWYDGLVNFLAIFCREKSTSLGAWRTRQRRSYFAAKLTDDWWIWCIDIALVRDMDQPQANYFVEIASRMKQGSNVILCSAEPGWYKAPTKGGSYRSLSYAAVLAKNAKRDLKVPLVLSGDTHHYARYSGGGTEYITSGGGGAFLHGTQDLADDIRPNLYRSKDVVLSLKTTPDESHSVCDKRACYPTQEQSLEMLNGNWRFAALNPGFSFLALGPLYAALALAITANLRWDTILVCFVVLWSGLGAYMGYQERFDRKIAFLSGAHALVQLVGVCVVSAVALWGGAKIWTLNDWNWIPWTVFVSAVSMTLGGAIAGTIFGLNLLVTCKKFGINNNDAFSSLRLDGHRHFLRVRVKGDTVTVFPISVEKVPGRDGWRINSERDTNKAASVFKPAKDLKLHLAEQEPITVKAHQALPISDAKAPAS